MVDKARFKLIEDLALQQGFGAVAALSVASAGPEFRDWYKSCIARGLTADMDYLWRDDRFELAAILSGAQSLFLFRYPYRFKLVDEKLRASQFKIARYAWQKDYHTVLKSKLMKVMHEAALDGRAVTDSAPLAERYWARLAGLGKIGRNGMLIAPGKGSYFLIAAYLSLEPLAPGVASVSNRASVSDDLRTVCGECRLCVDACPTAALLGDGLMEAQRCISYQTIEKREEQVDVFAGQKRHRWIFGCDVCQQVCPHNKPPGSFADSEFSDEHAAAETIAAGELPTSRAALKDSNFYRRGLRKLAANISAVRGT